MFFLYDRLPCTTTLFNHIKNPCVCLDRHRRDSRETCPKGESQTSPDPGINSDIIVTVYVMCQTPQTSTSFYLAAFT
jgi:hypothetical protein